MSVLCVTSKGKTQDSQDKETSRTKSRVQENTKNPVSGKKTFFLSSTWRAALRPIQSHIQGLRLGCEEYTHLCLLPKLRMSGALPVLPL